MNECHSGDSRQDQHDDTSKMTLCCIARLLHDSSCYNHTTIQLQCHLPPMPQNATLQQKKEKNFPILIRLRHSLGGILCRLSLRHYSSHCIFV
jgi:hypothetical protein